MDSIENSPWFTDAREAGRPVVKDPPKFDLESYIANYEGRTQLQRLFLIGSTSTYLSLDALRTAITLAKQGKDVALYQEAVERLHSINPDESMAVLDTAWCDRKTKEIKAEQENLESQLKGYKNNLIKESIRMGHDDLGQFYSSMGDHSNAMKSFARERDYCTSTQHIADMSLKLILTGINQNNWTTVNSNIAKIHPMNLKPEDRAKLDPICAAIMGLSQLATGNYREAARHFLSVSPSFLTAEPQAGIHWQKQVLTANDIAVYGGLCALASMDRTELQRRVLDNNEFRQFLELEPHIRRAVSLFCGSKYTAALEILEAYRTDYLLDLYLQVHVKELYGRVRSKSIVQYFIPFSCVTLDEMGRAFASSSDLAVEDELVDMIQRGILDARIDLVDRLLIAPPTNPRATAHATALKMAQDYERTLRLRLLRLGMLDAGLVLKAPKGHLRNGKPKTDE
ncbi:COP9 signalosome-like protein complex subunit 1 [Saccharata proteae CBS 121410]|uniref:COP9 signalosome complex subunit 1 n=1 Tax=Saccharata proteae CBS 121410 TaxID=1314787 RepID=A0A6A5YBP0_9PEZI|nr:COP9 signalosome-like protein complex subunit 1 [Saccharata proteae CBS 121410]